MPTDNMPDLDPWLQYDPTLQPDHPLLGILTDKVVEVLEVAPGQVLPDAHLNDDLGADSLDLIELVEALEAEFGVRIDDNDLKDVTTVGEAYGLIQAKLNQ